MGKLKVTVSDEQIAEKLKLEYRKQILNAQGWVRQLAYDDCWQRDVTPSVAFPSGVVYMTFNEAWASTVGCEDLEVEVVAMADAADAAAEGKLKLRLWVCEECGIARAISDIEHYEKFPPVCNLHKDHWPDGEFERSVRMLKSYSVIGVEASKA